MHFFVQYVMGNAVMLCSVCEPFPRAFNSWVMNVHIMGNPTLNFCNLFSKMPVSWFMFAVTENK